MPKAAKKRTKTGDLPRKKKAMGAKEMKKVRGGLTETKGAVLLGDRVNMDKDHKQWTD